MDYIQKLVILMSKTIMVVILVQILPSFNLEYPDLEIDYHNQVTIWVIMVLQKFKVLWEAQKTFKQ